MLVLTRRVGQEIRIGDGIRVRVVAIAGNKIRLAVAAPRSISVDREEVYLRRCGLSTESADGRTNCPVKAMH